MANLAVSYGASEPHQPQTRRVRTVLPPLFIVPVLVHIDAERRIDDTWSKRLEEVEDEDAGRERGVFERPDRACS